MMSPVVARKIAAAQKGEIGQAQKIRFLVFWIN